MDVAYNSDKNEYDNLKSVFEMRKNCFSKRKYKTQKIALFNGNPCTLHAIHSIELLYFLKEEYPVVYLCNEQIFFQALFLNTRVYLSAECILESKLFAKDVSKYQVSNVGED